jgi:hypothetical protein
VIRLPDHRASHRYWAFISYSTRDQEWARALHRRLEGYRLPRRVRPGPDLGVPSVQRLRPVFRDRDELPASADLDGRLREALDQSRYLIVLASRASAGSRWVDAEVRHFIDAGRIGDIFLVVLDGKPDTPLERGVLPLALEGRTDEALWVDARRNAKPSRTSFLRLVAGMLGIGFDALWRRDRRRWRYRLAIWAAVVTLLAGSTGGVLWRQQVIQERDKPERQIAAFRQYFTHYVLSSVRADNPSFPASAIDFQIVRTDDLNGDNLIDFFVFNKTDGFCGSRACQTEVYLSEGGGKYKKILDLFGASTPRTRSHGSDRWKEILATGDTVDSEPAYSVFRWTNNMYELVQYEFCNGTFIEYCDPRSIIMPLDSAVAGRTKIRPDAVFRNAPTASAPAITRIDPKTNISTWDVLGETADGQWYLVDIWKGDSGFVGRSDVSQQ